MPQRAQTLRGKIVRSLALLIAGLLLLTAASLWTIHRLNKNQELWRSHTQALHKLYSIGLDVAVARDALASNPPQRQTATGRINSAINKLTSRLTDLSPHTEHNLQPANQQSLESALPLLRNLLSQLRTIPSPIFPSEPNSIQLLGAIDQAQNKIGAAAQKTTRTIEQLQDSGRKQLRASLIFIASLAAAIILGAVFIGASLYQSVMSPLNQLARGVRQIAQGRFTPKLPQTGDQEFAAVASDFNTMASELHNLYQELENNVAAKSKELVRSERLASVGFLAAGVAHEINNPLAIIAGHAELSINSPNPQLESTLNSLQIIRDEAFRCKQIIEKLLSLSRPDSSAAQNISLSQIAQEVAAMAQGLRNSKNKKLLLDLPGSDTLVVHANANEMKQVLLNLTINALDAVEDSVGQVTIHGREDDRHIQLAVTDNGKGMSPHTLERIFEPFYTEKRGSPDPAQPGNHGTGLGLSVVHAIVHASRGQITAHSDGPKKGSRFVIQLPKPQNTSQ